MGEARHCQLAMALKPQNADYGEWMSLHGAVLRRWLSGRVNPADVEDVVQEIFLRVQSANKKEPITNIRAYLFTTARHVLANRFRDQAREGAFMRNEWPQRSEVADLLSPERYVIGFEEYQRVILAIENLPPRARQAFELSRFEGLSYAAIANRLDIKPDSAKELVHRALVKIVKEFGAAQ